MSIDKPMVIVGEPNVRIARLWDGTVWNRRTITGAIPAPRNTMGFGGRDQGIFGDTWEWDGTTWSRFQSTSTPPDFDLLVAAAYDDRMSHRAASWLSYGTGCPGSSGTPALSASDPRLAVLLGATSAMTPLTPTCHLLVGSILGDLVVVANSFGFATLPLPLPLAINLSRASVFAQAFVGDPRGIFGLVAPSNGVRLSPGF